jgi:hypothetical protein
VPLCNGKEGVKEGKAAEMNDGRKERKKEVVGNIMEGRKEGWVEGGMMDEMI